MLQEGNIQFFTSQGFPQISFNHWSSEQGKKGILEIADMDTF